MMELTIKDIVYKFNFGMGFLKAINKEAKVEMDYSGNKKNMGLVYCVGGLLDKEVEDLAKVLEMANKGQNPRLTSKAIEDYIDNECEDIEALFDTVLDFLEQSNACKLITKPLRENWEKDRMEAETETKK